MDSIKTHSFDIKKYLGPNTVKSRLSNSKYVHMSTVKKMIKWEMSAMKKSLYYRKDRYNIWDMLIDNIMIIVNNLSLCQNDQYYLCKLFNNLGEQYVVHPSLEFYCLRQFIKIPGFRSNTELLNIQTQVQTYLSKLIETDGSNTNIKTGCKKFSWNIRKMKLIKKLYKTSVYLDTEWYYIYHCYLLGKSVLYKEIDQTDILDVLNIKPIVEYDIPEDIELSESELDTVSQLSIKDNYELNMDDEFIELDEADIILVNSVEQSSDENEYNNENNNIDGECLEDNSDVVVNSSDDEWY